MKLVFTTLLFCLFVFSTTGCKKQETKEIFFSKSTNDLVAFTGSPGGLLPPTPTGIKEFDEKNLMGSIAVITQIRNSLGEVIGIATEMEFVEPQGNDVFTDTDWTLKIPGRGTVHLTQVENVNFIVNAISDMKKNGEITKSFTPPIEVITTVPGTGKITGGTKEFENITGICKETNRLHSLNLKTGEIDLEFELEITYKKK